MPHSIELSVIDLRNPPLDAEAAARMLSPDEQSRAGRFRFPHLQRNFRVGRGMLRLLLSAACKTAPCELRFEYSAQGKPTLLDFPGIHFNVSHSGDLWCCGISRRSAFGIDIERIHPLSDLDAIADRFFAPVEVEALLGYSESARLAAFFRCWTRKEAYIKALGDGLSRGLSTFAVSCGEEERSPVRDTLSQEAWIIESFMPAPGYTGAIAIPND